MNVSRILSSCSNFDAFIVVSCEKIVKTEINLIWGIVDKRVPDEASTSGGTEYVQYVLGGAALGFSLCLDPKLVLNLGRSSVSLEARHRSVSWREFSLGFERFFLVVASNLLSNLVNARA